jgi:hypothetical protein
MSDVKISQLPAATTPLSGSELIAVVQGSATRKVEVSALDGGLIGVQDLANPQGSLFTTLQGFINRLRTPTDGYGAGIIPFSSDVDYPDASVANELIPKVTLAILPSVVPKVGKVVYVQDSGREGFFRWRTGNYSAKVAADTYKGIYCASNVSGYGPTVGCWVRLWDEQNGKPEWFGVVPNSSGDAAANDARIAACYAMVPHTRFGPHDYWVTTTIKANISHHKISGCGEKYNDQFGAMTRIISTSNSATIILIGPDTQPNSINEMPQGIQVKSIYFTRSVPPLISSNCIGVHTRWVLNSVIEDVKSDNNMVGFQEQGTVHLVKIKCESVRASAGSGGGTDYFIGHYAYGGGNIGAAGGNASLYNIDCVAGCNYGPLQTASGSIGFKADQGFTDVWYWNPETTNFYIAQAVFGNGNTGLSFANVDFAIFHPIHDQFKHAGIYITDVAASGAVEIENPYFGPSTSARACLWFNSNEGGAVSCNGGQFVMGIAPLAQAILIEESSNCDILGFPKVLEHGNNYPILSCSNSSNCHLTVRAVNPTVTAGAIIQLSGTCSGIVAEPKASGKPSAFQYGIQVVGTGDSNSEYRVTGVLSSCLPNADRKLNRNGTPITSIGLTDTNYAVGVFT